MAQQVIKCPDGTLAVFSTIVDAWVMYNATPEETIEWFVEQAAEDARRHAKRVVDAVMADRPRDIYYQFAIPFEDANQASIDHDGEDWYSEQPST